MNSHDNEHDDRHDLTDEDRARVVRGMYTSTMTVRNEEGEDFHMLDGEFFLADGTTVQMWIPVPLLVGLIESIAKVLQVEYPPQTVTQAEFSDDALRQMAEDFAREHRDVTEDPFPDRKHDDGDDQ